MAMDIAIRGTTGTQAEVDSNNNLKVTLPSSKDQAGYSLMLSEVSEVTDPGGSIRREPEATDDFVLRVGTDQILLNANFGGSATSANAIQQDIWKQTATTMTATAGSGNNGFLRLNSGSSVTITQGVAYQTYPVYQTYGSYPTYFEWEARVINCSGAAAGATTGGATGKVIEIGVGLVTSATSAGLLDGFCFRFTSAGILVGVLSIAGTEYTTANLPLPTDNVTHRWTIVSGQDGLEFWIDNSLQAVLAAPSDAVAPSLQSNLPILLRVYNATAPSLAPQLEVAEVFVSQGNMTTNKPWPHVMAGMGGHSALVPYGTAVGETSNRANATAVPATAVGTNTTAAVLATLGGLGRMTAQATNIAAAGDMVFSSYQVPAQTATQASRRLFITGVMISCSNGGAAVATTPTTLHWMLAWGHTALTLATTDAVGAKAPRHLPLGQMSAAIGTAVGGMYDRDIVRNFTTPIVVNPGEYIAATCRFLIGTATASQEVVGSIGFEGYWE